MSAPVNHIHFDGLGEKVSYPDSKHAHCIDLLAAFQTAPYSLVRRFAASAWLYIYHDLLITGVIIRGDMKQLRSRIYDLTSFFYSVYYSDDRIFGPPAEILGTVSATSFNWVTCLLPGMNHLVFGFV